jgi:small basic protein (TIGR04137 family)
VTSGKQTSCSSGEGDYPPRPFSQPQTFTIMSQHRSLKTSGSVGTKRSVLKRGERIKIMKARGQWAEGRLPTGLPKTKSE